MPDFDEKNRLGDLYPTSYCGPREIMMAPNEDGKSLKPEPILMTTGTVWPRDDGLLNPLQSRLQSIATGSCNRPIGRAALDSP